MTLDARGVPVSSATPADLARYETALRSSRPTSATRRHDRFALADSPDFVLGHLFKALALFTASEKQFVPMAEASLGEATRREARANDRERGLMAATRGFLDGDWDEACRRLDHVLADQPRDVLALQTAHIFDFFRGDALNLRNRVSRVLPHWDAGAGPSYVLGMHAFGLEEMNQYPEAEATGRRALELQPKDAWAVHAATHVMEMQGRIGEGVAWLESRRDDWAPDNSSATTGGTCISHGRR
jgi:hypothetical protein